jgi:hypothetical protein
MVLVRLLIQMGQLPTKDNGRMTNSKGGVFCITTNRFPLMKA